MQIANLDYKSWLPWRAVFQKEETLSRRRDCTHYQRQWGALGRRPAAVRMKGAWYCADLCLEPTLAECTRRLRSLKPPAVVHRVPLGLLLLSRHQLTVEQLRVALAAQRSAGYGKIGEWLQKLGFVTEQQITAAVARQWSCPVLQPNSSSLRAQPGLQLPVALLESCLMLPLDYVEATSTLYVAFGESIDYSVLYALEQMLACRTSACLAGPSLLRQRLRALSQHRTECEIVFERVAGSAELARIVRSYCLRVSATEIRMACCGPHLWFRLLRRSAPPLDLLLRPPLDSPLPQPSASTR